MPSFRSLLTAAAGLATVAEAWQAPNTTAGQCATARYERQPRAFICTDVSNEPDDQMSLVRLLTYANEINITSLASVTSYWKNDSIDQDTIRQVLGGYGAVRDNLNANLPRGAALYPTEQDLLGRMVAGYSVYGLAALDEPVLSQAAQQLVRDVDAASAPDDPQWVLLWGGANVLAEALHHVQKERIPAAVDAFVAKLRVYAISDQDNSGEWIRRQFPALHYVVSLHAFNEYVLSSWGGISGELFRHFDAGGPDSSLVTNEWLQTHIRFGPLGAHYPHFAFIMEGDTPSFFPLIQNGLGQPEHPEWGSWGGRFRPMDVGSTVEGGRLYAGTFGDAPDFVEGQNGAMFFSSYSTIWRWRQAYQSDFAGRMLWTVSGSANTSAANHAPVVVVNGTCGPRELQLDYRLGESLVLDASESWDPDSDGLAFSWLHYRDVVQRLEGPDIDRVSKNVTITPIDASGSVVEVTPLDNITMHIILSVQDERPTNFTTYRRVILNPVA